MSKHTAQKHQQPSSRLGIKGLFASNGFEFQLRNQTSAVGPAVMRDLLSGKQIFCEVDDRYRIEEVGEKESLNTRVKRRWILATGLALALILAILTVPSQQPPVVSITPCLEPSTGMTLDADAFRVEKQLEFGGVIQQRIEAQCDGRSYLIGVDKKTKKVTGVRGD
jgi:xanthosine utilization system XapX-like protein